MKRRTSGITDVVTMFLILFVGCIFMGVASSSAADEGVANQAQIYSGDEGGSDTLREMIVGATPKTHTAMHGTGWVPERRNKFQTYKYMGGGTYTKLKAAGEEWVHIPLPYATLLDGNWQKISFVQFCAESSNGKFTKPISIHLWENAKRFYMGNISWPEDNKYHCHDVFVDPPVWKEALGISVLLKYDSPADSITLRKAWVQTEP